MKLGQTQKNEQTLLVLYDRSLQVHPPFRKLNKQHRRAFGKGGYFRVFLLLA
jgi:hypothetical protein